jgi:hypothetical protein
MASGLGMVTRGKIGVVEFAAMEFRTYGLRIASSEVIERIRPVVEFLSGTQLTW